MKEVEDFESRPHKAVSFLVEGRKETQELNEQKLPEVLVTVEEDCQEEA